MRKLAASIHAFGMPASRLPQLLRHGLGPFSRDVADSSIFGNHITLVQDGIFCELSD